MGSISEALGGRAGSNGNESSAHSSVSPNTSEDIGRGMEPPTTEKTTIFHGGHAHTWVSSGSKEIMPIAIVGMSCRLSGDVSTAEEFWEMCSRARSGWSEIPNERFSQQGYFHPNPAKSGTYNPKGGHFLREDISLFDAPFFNITAQESRSLDPQQRLLLECSYEALENGGIPKENIIGANIGVFVGGSFSDYTLHCLRDTDTAPLYEATGNAASLMSNRLSYYFDLKGPSVTVDTACSSSLSALHLACQSLRTGESSQAIVGGSHLNLLPDFFISMSMSRLFSDAGKSYSFDHRASGYGRGEGVACIVLKPLSDAVENGDKIRAVIRNTGMNQDGRTQGITMPNGSAQEELIRSVYDSAGLDINDTGYVEAHGTGTKVGDPIEAGALYSVFGQDRSPLQPLFVGSVKSNIGHTEGASGVISVIKAALMLEKGFILPSINFETPNKEIPLSKWNMKVPTSQLPWPRSKRFVSINNFGFGGTNVHVVLEGPPRASKILTNGARTNIPNAISGKSKVRKTTIGSSDPKPRHLYLLSANSEESVRSQMKSIELYLEQRPETFELSLMSKLAYTLGQRRSLLPWKVAVSAASGSELIRKLSSSTVIPLRSFDKPRIGFVFTGQGAQWNAMGRELLQCYPIFTATITAADNCLVSLGAHWSLVGELSRDAKTSRVENAYISQPACTAIQLALVDLLASWDIRPSAVVGHSSGEIAGAYAAGILSLKACMTIAYHRGLATVNFASRFPALKGAMLAVGGGETEVRPLLKGLRSGCGQVVIACINSPSSITASGDEEAIIELQTRVEGKRLFNRKLRVDMAYHSHHMSLVAEDYLTAIIDTEPLGSPNIAYYSSVTAHQIDGLELNPSYWVDNLTSPVQFSRALQRMCISSDKGTSANDAINTLIELGPHSALEGPIKQTLKSAGQTPITIGYVPSLVRGSDAIETMQQLAASLVSRGARLNFSAINFPKPRDNIAASLLTDLPRYPWQHSTKHWHESRISNNHRFARRWPRNDVLGGIADDSNDLEPRWRNIIRLDDLPWVRDHRIQSNNVYPIAGYIIMVVEAASQRAASRAVSFEEFVIRELSASRPLIINEKVDVETMITLRPYSEGTRTSTDAWDEFRVFSWASDKGWIEHCRGIVGVHKAKVTNAIDGQRQFEDAAVSIKRQISIMKKSCTEAIELRMLAETLANVGVVYGPAFQGIVACKVCEQHAIADVKIPDTAGPMPNHFEPELIMHPATLDLIIQILWPLLGAGRAGWDQLYMPSFIKKLTISRHIQKRPGDHLSVYGSRPKVTSSAVKPVELSIFATESGSEEACVVMEGCIFTPVYGKGMNSGRGGKRALCFRMDWEPFLIPNTGSSAPYPEAEVTIISPEFPTEFSISELASSLEELTGKSPRIGSLLETDPNGKICIVLAELDKPFLSDIVPEEFGLVQQLLTTARGIIWVVRGAYQGTKSPNANMVTGLARTIRSETALRFVTVDLDQPGDTPNAVETIATIFRITFAIDASIEVCEMEYMERSGVLYVPRIVNDDKMNTSIHQQTQDLPGPDLQPFSQMGRPLKMTVGSPGLLDTLHFIDDYTRGEALPDDHIEIEIKAIGLNFKDVMIAMGQLVNEHIGTECSGIITAIGRKVLGDEFAVGDRVCAMAEGSFATHIRCKATSVSKIRDDMSFEVAATMPVVWSTAYYSLIDLGRLCKGDTVLIHAAAGGVGQAAIILSQMIGAEIFVTVGSVEKKAFIKTYNIPDDHIFFSRDTSFANGVMAATKGRGVDVVLNSLAGDALRVSWECLAHFGRFVEIGKRDIVTNTRLEMAPFAYNTSFSSVDLTVVAAERPQLMKRLLSDVFKLHQEGMLKSIPITVFPVSEVESAFRTLQSGKNIGKVAVKPSAADQAIPAKLQTSLLRQDALYIIVGGTGGLGRSIAEWMARNGARHIILLSRSPAVKGKVKDLIQKLEQLEANVSVRQCNVAEQRDVEKIVAECTHDMPPIRGVIHSAMILNDVLFEKMKFEDYAEVVKPKVAGAWNLHNSLLKSDLDFFITLSSAAGIIGNRGQAAYSAASTFMDAFTQYRIGMGLPATTIDLAAVSDVGYLAENLEMQALVMGSMGSEGIDEMELHALMAAAIGGKMSSCRNHCITGLDIGPAFPATTWISDSKFSRIRSSLVTEHGVAPEKLAISLGYEVAQAQSLTEVEQIIYRGLAVKISEILMVPLDDIQERKPISAYGLDSLVAVEIRNWIARELDVNLQVLEMLSSGSLMVLCQTILKKSSLVNQKLFSGEGEKGVGGSRAALGKADGS
ncbi:Uncharacterized protein BP5553_09553 [Venustampulla echinocandica]|uniref:Uncharacterized protein n=1 Tax=Venustampulla echinocandica TaxID=2656787 RepID=A0A370TBB5_9HELO|nr:Uncharacterized protein BP5553_09553 [Venustampulla echinocandica]RDL31344.1 Uncharacterized protein BP5553_09553 [Venustampulla echinocandica]